MLLQEKLDAIKQQSAAQMPPETLEIMKESLEEIEATGVRERVLRVGDSAPRFQLPNQDGNAVELNGLLEQGPVVISFYRGKW